jgi:hypothetical protein
VLPLAMTASAIWLRSCDPDVVLRFIVPPARGAC